MAWVNCPAMPEIPVEWQANTEVTSIRKEEKAFLFRTKAGNKAFTFAITFPKLGGVRVTQSKGFFACEENLPIAYSGKKVLKMAAGDSAITFRRDEAKGFVLDILNKDGRVVLSLNGESIAFGFAGNKIKKVKKVKLVAAFQKHEVLYGLGERSNTLNQVGHDALMWNVDTGIHGPGGDNGVDHNEAYQCVPILHSSAGYTLYANTMYAGWMDFGKTVPHQYILDFNGPETDFFIFTGTPKENLKSYTDLTGHSIIPPKWAFQYWMGGGAPQWMNHEDQTDTEHYKKALRAYIDGYKDMGIPHIAACYGEGYPSINPAGYEIAAESGMRMLIWNHPSQDVEFSKKVLGTEDWRELPQITDKHFERVKMQTGGHWIDFTNPNTIKVLREFYKSYFDWGLKGAMIDFGEFVSADALMYNGKDGNAMHNEHSYWYAKTMKAVFEERCGDDYILFQRSGCAGSQSFVGQFGGDQASRFYGLQQAYYSGINMGASGFNIWGSDIGGYNGSPTPELYMRWLEYATFSPLMRAHGVGTERNPWAYGEMAVELFKKLYWWRENMLDYIYGSAIHAHYTAEPLMRVMAIEFPEQDLAEVDSQYMFGSELLVAPIIDEGRRCKMVAFPQGHWVNLWTAQRIEGDRSVMVSANDDDIPVYLRAGAAMVLKVAESLRICDSMADGAPVPVLLTTPADGKRTVRQYVDAKTYAEFVTDRSGDAVLTVENVNGTQLEAVLVYGADVRSVLVDGKKADFVCEDNKTVIRTPHGFKTVSVF